MSDEVKAVEFIAEIRQVKTMADHTVNVTFNLPEYCKAQAAWFLQQQGSQVHSVTELVIRETLTELNDEAKKEAKRSGDQMGHRRIRDRRDQRTSGEVQSTV